MAQTLVSIATAVTVVVGTVTLLPALYLLGLALAALAYRAPVPFRAEPHTRLAVLIPAFNEADLIARCVRSLQDQSYPSSLVDIVVIADNCTDGTASIARTAGAEVLERSAAARGKGQALRWAIDRLLERPSPPDAIVVVDADSVADRHLLAELTSRHDAGADAVQAEYLVLDGDRSARSELRAVAFLLFHRTRFRGRSVLRLPCSLVGNGMLLSRELLTALPWSAFTGAEDLEYSIDLRLAGIRPAFAGSALVRGPVATDARAEHVERHRWEGGRLHVVRTRLPVLVATILRQRRLGLLDAAVDLAVPPLGTLAAAVALGTGSTALLASLGAVHPWALAPWAAATAAVCLYVVVGLRAAQAPSSTYRILLRAPAFLFFKVTGLREVIRGSHGEPSWVRTPRPSDSAATSPPISIGGVPIACLDTDGAVESIMAAARRRSFAEVSTVNLDFLVNGRRDREVGEILRQATINLADGSPVVWLVRLLRGPIVERVPGADLVPRLLEAAAAQGLRVFFLGGEDGVAEAAAARMRAVHPNLHVDVYEPPRTALAAMDDTEIFRRLEAAAPQLLFVAFGHPKQEKWIYRHRERLPMVAIGVGCSFDLLAGKRGRAPAWMQAAGLEWAYRVAHEPRRLARRYAVDAVWLGGVFLPAALLARLRGGPAVTRPGSI